MGLTNNLKQSRQHLTSQGTLFRIMQMLQNGTKKNYVATLCTIFALVDVIGVAGFDCRRFVFAPRCRGATSKRSSQPARPDPDHLKADLKRLAGPHQDDTPSKIQRANFLMAKLLQGLDTSSLQKWGNFDRNREPSIYWGKVLGQPYNEKVSIKRDPWIRGPSHTPSVNDQMTKEPNDMTSRWALVH